VSGRGTHRTRIKICGIREPSDAAFAADAGADAIGVVFHGPSSRNVGIDGAREIARALPPFVALVGLVVDMPADDIRRMLAALPLALLQFHGDPAYETDDFCAQFGRPYLKALRVKPGDDLLQSFGSYRGAAGMLVDAYRPGIAGGTGETFDWDLLPSQHDVRLVLSGGLTPENAGEAIARVRPWAVDVSSGVESAPGVKDRARISAFIDAVHRADNRRRDE
jgi:phosphoribosylanthranilate isomerase